MATDDKNDIITEGLAVSKDGGTTPATETLEETNVYEPKNYSNLDTSNEITVPLGITDYPDDGKYQVEKLRWTYDILDYHEEYKFDLYDIMTEQSSMKELYELYQITEFAFTVHGAHNSLTIRNLINVMYLNDPERDPTLESLEHAALPSPWSSLRHNGIVVVRAGHETMVTAPTANRWLYTRPGAVARLYKPGKLIVLTAGGKGASLRESKITVAMTIKYKIPTLHIEHLTKHTYVDNNWVATNVRLLPVGEATCAMIVTADPEWIGRSLTFTNPVTIDGEVTLQPAERIATAPFHVTIQHLEQLATGEYFTNVPWYYSDMLLENDGLADVVNYSLLNEGEPYWAIIPLS